MAPRSTPTSHPGRYLAALGVLIVVMLVSVLGGNILKPGDWHKSFVVGRGLDLSSGTSITLQALTPKGQTPSQGEMTKAIQIMTNRVESTGLTGSEVVQQGPNEIVVSVPGAGAQKVATLVGETALLRFRQVLLEAPNETTASSTTTPSPSPSSTPSASSSTSPSPSSSTSASGSASPSPSSGSGQAAGASKIGATATPTPSSSGSSSPKASSSPSPSPSPSSSASGKPVLSTTTNGATGDPGALNPTTTKLFNELNCNKNWKQLIYHSTPSAWDNPKAQTVTCLKIAGYGWEKYALAAAVVQGKDIYNVSAQDTSTGQGWIVSVNVKSPASTALGALTSTMATKYYDSSTGAATSPLDLLGIVLDGTLQGTPPQVQGQFTTSFEITGGGSGGFSQGQATTLADVLKYGSLPLSFKNLYTSSVSASLGSDQLSAGLFAALVGLLLVVVYSFTYYRGLGVVSVSSLAIAAALSYLSVVLLSRYASFTLSLAGIAGLIVAIGITADSFIVYFERLRDEVREGRSLRAAVERGWGRARRTILVSDTVSFLAALLLYILSEGDVRGFAFTLGLTTLVDVIVVFLFTKPMVTLLARTKFYGQGRPLSGLDPARLGARAPWRGGGSRPAVSGSAGAATTARTSTTTREA
ncbi:MAG TPA: protein translocase subunit SecD [Streptosporangiaceae bacterium]|nr:protein translocase subunit SecD [Streptosporangiaceae bacterium]